MNEKTSSTNFTDKAKHILFEIGIWMIYHPFTTGMIIFAGLFIIPQLPNWYFMWGITAFYPAHFDYSTICIGGGCP